MKLNIERTIDLAAITASLSDRPKHKTGCVLLDRSNRVISVGMNMMKTHPVQYRYAKQQGNEKACYLHAEVAALVRLKDHTEAYTAVVVRLLANGRRSMAKPCKACEAALLDAGVSQVYFTNKKGEVEKSY